MCWIRTWLIFFLTFCTKTSLQFILVASSDSLVTFQKGVKLFYDYKSHGQLKQGALGASQESRSRHLSFKVDATLAVTHLWQSTKNETLLQFEVDVNGISTWYGTKSPVDGALNGIHLSKPFLIVLKNDDEATFFSSEQDRETLNFQRGLASLFIFKQENNIIEEVDVLGSCKTKYSQDHHGLHKVKETCQSGKSEDDIFGTRKFSNAKYLYKLQDSGVIDSLEVREWFELFPNLTPELAQDLQQRQLLTLREQLSDNAWNDFKAADVTEAIKAISEIHQLDFKSHGIAAVHDGDNHGNKAKSLKAVLASSKKHLKDKSLATKESAEAFGKLLKSINHASRNDVLQVLKDKSLQDVSAQILDVIGASDNLEAHDAAYEVFVNPAKTGRMDLFERYMVALAQSKHCMDDLIERFLKDAQKARIPHERLKKTLVLTLASLSKKTLNSEMRSKILKWIVTAMVSCKDNDCYQDYLRALKSAKSVAILPILLKIVESAESNKKTALLALETMTKFDKEDLRVKINDLDQHLLTLLKDPDQEISLKSTAIELILLTKPNVENLKEVLNILKIQRDKELTAIALQKWMDLAINNPHLKGLMGICIGNAWLDWNLMSHGGLSTSFSRILSHNQAGNSSFTFNLEVSGMLMKRSNFELKFLTENGNRNNLIELEIFAGGLSSMIGDGTKDDDSDANGGMILNVLGNQLRPYVFFSSMGELMSLYWSGAAEEKTSALKGNLMLQQGSVTLFLSNGMEVAFQNQGIISFDLSGQAKISMWTKQSNSIVENSVAYLMTQSTNLNFLKLPTFSQETELHTKYGLNLENDIEFSDKVETCIKMSQPEAKISQVTQTKWLSSHKVTSKVTTKIHGRTLFLNEKNSELCNQMYPK